MSGRKLTRSVVFRGNVYEAGTSESDIKDASKIGADVWDSDTGGGGDVTGYNALKVADLETEAEKRGLEVEGTGKDGKVVKADLVAALEAADAATGS